MAVYKYVNKSSSALTVTNTQGGDDYVFTGYGGLEYSSTQVDLDAVEGISVDKYINGVEQKVTDFNFNEVPSMRVDALGVNVAVSTSTNVNLKAGTTAKSSMRIAEGVAPTSPVDGDVWVAADHKLYIRLNGVTKEIAFV